MIPLVETGEIVIQEKVTLRKYEGDQTDTPFEEIVMIDGKIVEVRRYPNGTNE